MANKTGTGLKMVRVSVWSPCENVLVQTNKQVPRLLIHVLSSIITLKCVKIDLGLSQIKLCCGTSEKVSCNLAGFSFTAEALLSSLERFDLAVSMPSAFKSSPYNSVISPGSCPAQVLKNTDEQ